MYLDHFGLSEPPFRITPDTDFFFQGANRGATLEALAYAITHDEGIVKVTGEVGSGKTMLCRVLMERLPKNVETIYLANPSLSREEILYAIADELKLGLNASRTTRLMRALLAHLIQLFSEGRRVVVLIDEAHAMPKETLEEIRLLSNLESNRHKLLQMVLFGQPELDQHLNTADMRQLKERITHSFRLEPLVRSDIESYIDFRMRAAGYRGPSVFSPAALRLITEASEGLTRRVNILADKALLAAFADGSHAVTDKEVKRAIADSEFYRPPRSLQKYWAGAGALAAGLALGWGVSVWFSACTECTCAGKGTFANGPRARCGRNPHSGRAAVHTCEGKHGCVCLHHSAEVQVDKAGSVSSLGCGVARKGLHRFNPPRRPHRLHWRTQYRTDCATLAGTHRARRLQAPARSWHRRRRLRRPQQCARRRPSLHYQTRPHGRERGRCRLPAESLLVNALRPLRIGSHLLLKTNMRFSCLR